MEFKPKNREWVKNAAIIFLAVLLVLTFFSNTFMNRTLPEVATQYVTNGSITAKVRGTGTVAANGNHQVKAEEDRIIRAVMVKTGQEVNAGDVLFVIGEGDSDDLEAAQDALRTLQNNYQRTALSLPTFNYDADQRRVNAAKTEMDEAKKALDAASTGLSPADKAKIEELKANLEAAKVQLAEFEAKYEAECEAAQDVVTAAQAKVDRILKMEKPEVPDGMTADSEEYKKLLEDAKTELANAKAAYKTLTETPNTNVEMARSLRDLYQSQLDTLIAASETSAYKEAQAAYRAAEENYYTLSEALAEKKAADNKSQQLTGIDLADISIQIERQKQKVLELSGGDGNQITAKVSGTVQSIECTSGDMKLKGDVLCTVEVPDMGYTLSFSVTNDQAKRLRPGDSATVSNYYWGSQIIATLKTITVDPKNPQSNKLLTFDLTGDVNTGAELTISVGQKSASYDTIVPNSAIRTDTNGSFVLIIEAKNSPLGNRFIARRVDVEVLASDDMNSAVTGDFSYGTYVITTSNGPVNNGDQVRMADS